MKISRRLTRFLALVLLSLGFAVQSHAVDPQLVLQPKDHISILGNTLAERLQHDGWLETRLQIRFPDLELSVRNLGFSGDELTQRLRSQDFGSPDSWLAMCHSDVIFAFFGHNESFAGEAGLPQFRLDLANFIDATRSQKYNGTSPPRLVLFSPIPHEDLKNPHLPDGKADNVRIALYTRAMSEVAKEKGVPFVDLFTPLSRRYSDSVPLTMNGIHLTDAGNRVLAEEIEAALFGLAPKAVADATTQAVRAAVLDKDLHWFHRYRTTDGYSIYGGRADLAFTDGQTNREVMRREMEILDVMTANRDQRIWGAAQGKSVPVDDSNTPPFIPVITNKPGTLPGGKHEFLDGPKSLAQMTVGKGLEVNLFASEEQFPELANPVQMAFDPAGRLWVAAWPSYPHWQPKDPINDKLLIFSDTNGDGKADAMKVFADGLDNPTGFELWGGGVLVAQAPDLWFLKDTDGDDRADVRQRVLHGLDSADTHHTSNSFTLGPGGELYFQEGTFHHTQVETAWGPPLRNANAAVYRYEPRSGKFSAYVNFGFANPHGHVFDRWGQDFVTDGTGNVNYYAAGFSGHMPYPKKHSSYFPFFEQRIRPSAATEFVSSRHFPDELQGNYLVANVIGFQGILRYRVEEDAAGFKGEETDPIIFSSDPNFRPVDLEFAPDGSLYFVDWQNPIIGHMQHNLRDPSRDKIHGRVYRIRHKTRPLLPVVSFAGLPVPELLEYLKEPENRVRHRVRIELSGRSSAEVLAATQTWINGLDRNDPEFEHHRLEGLWVYQQHDQVNEPLLQEVLDSPNPKARAAAVRVLCAWRDRIDTALDSLKKKVADPFPRVRLEAVRACSFFEGERAAEIALEALRYPQDRFLAYTLQETLIALEPYWQPAIAGGRPIAKDNPVGVEFLLKGIRTSDLQGMFRSPPVLLAMLSREGVMHADRQEALIALAQQEGKSVPQTWLAAVQRIDVGDSPTAPAILADLAHMLPAPGDAAYREYIPLLTELARTARLPVTRQIAFAAQLDAGESVDAVWNQALQSLDAFMDFVDAVPLIRSGSAKAALHPRLVQLLDGLPPELKVNQGQSVAGRFVRISLPGPKRTLTLAEVQVFSDGLNIAPSGTASQSTTVYGAVAQRAVDGIASPHFSDNSMAHTMEDQSDPWWELDLGRVAALEKIIVWNREEESDSLALRMDRWTLQVLDANHQEVFAQRALAAPRPKSEMTLNRDWVGGARRGAIRGLSWTGVDEAGTFQRLCDTIRKGMDRTDAIRSLAKLPRRSWVDAEIEPLVRDVADRLKVLPAAERTTTEALEELALARNLATAIPGSLGQEFRRALKDLGVQVVVLRPVPHQIAFDRKQIYVEAGKGAEILFENRDVMPHNVVITMPGAMAKVGIAAEGMAMQPDGYERNFVPNLPEVLFSTRLLQPGQSEKLSFTAPSEVGEYPYVCTFPGHWRIMYGTMHVVPNLDDVPAEALAPIAETIVSTRTFVKDWKVSELMSGGEPTAKGRSFDRGKSLFTDVACIKCHRLGCDGPEVGPDLKGLQEKLTRKEIQRIDILREMIEPSAKIDPKYQTWIVTDNDGHVLSGIIAERTDQSIRLLTNPLDGSEPVTVAVQQVEDQQESKISLMPQGLLNTLSKDEILDLLWYVESCGDPAHAIYQSVEQK